MVVRVAELDRLRQHLLEARAGRGGAVVLVGEAGAGKTRLAQRLQDHAERIERFRIASARAVPSESALTYGGLYDAVEPLLGDLGRLTEAHRRVLLTALGYDLGPPVEPLALRVAMLGLLAAASARQPLLLVVDDVHWLDAETASILQFCARRLRHDPLLLVFTIRPGFDRSGFDAAETVELGPLTMPERRVLVREVAAGILDDGAVERIAASSGNPLLLCEAARAAGGGGRRGSSASLRPGPASVGTLPPVFHGRIAALDERARLALAAAAVDESAPAAILDVVLDALGIERAGLAPAFDDGLLLGEGRGVFCHPLAAVAAIEGVSTAVRAELHAHFAEAWAAAGAAERALRHREAARDRPGVADYVQVADRAAQRGAPAVAAAAYREAARLEGAPGEQAKLLLRSAEAYARAARLQEAATTLAELDGLDITRETLSDTALLRAQGLMWRGQLAAALELLMTSAAEVSATDPFKAVLYLTEVTNLHVMMGDGPSALIAAERTVDAGHGGDQLSAAFSTATLGRVLSLTGEGRVGRNGLQLMVATLPVVMSVPGAMALSGTAQVFGWLEDYSRARELLGRLAERGSIPLQERPFADACEADLLWRTGRLSASFAHALEALELAQELGHHAGYERATAARAAALLGRSDCDLLAQSALELADRAGIRSLGGTAAGALASLALAAGRVDDAVRWARRATGYVVGGDPCIMQIEPELIEALVQRGDVAEARVVHREFLDAAERTQGRWIRAAALRCEGQLRAGQDADAAFEEAATLADAEPSPVEQGRTYLRWGESLLARGARVRAVDRLQRAATLFERAGAQPWSDHTDRALRRAGRPRTPAPRLELSSHELQIAALVADGLTNRQIAERLYVSIKTVEYHLGNIYRRNGLRSRVALTRAFLDPAGGDPVGR